MRRGGGEGVVLMRVAEKAGMTLVYDTDDVEDVALSTTQDVIDVTRPEDKAIRRELGQAHLVLHVDFLPGKRARWIETETDRRA